MNIFKNLMFLQGHFIDPHMDDDYGQKYGHRDDASSERAERTAPAAAAAIAAAPGVRKPAPATASKKPIEITYLDVYYTR